MFPFSEEVGQTNAVGHLNGVVECLTPSGEHPQTHRVYGTGGAYPTLQANSGAVGCGVLLPVGADVYNHELTGAVAATFGRNSGGANNAGPKVMEAIPVALRGNRRAGEEGKLAETDGKGAAYSLTHVQTDSMVCTADAVAIGIGRDAFNSGANAKMSQSVSHQVQPPITAKGPGAVCATVIEGN